MHCIAAAVAAVAAAAAAAAAKFYIYTHRENRHCSAILQKSHFTMGIIWHYCYMLLGCMEHN